MNDSVFSVRDLNVELNVRRNGVPAHVVRDFALDLAPGEVVGIVGESGSGKSVSVRASFGLLRSSRTARVAGTITFGKQRLSEMSGRELRQVWAKSLGLVLQDPVSALNPMYSIRVQIHRTIRVAEPDIASADLRARTAAVLARMSLPDSEQFLDRFPHQLSGGMRQRVAIALAVAKNPTVLFADEPTTALDVTVQRRVLDLLGELQRSNRMAMVLVSHDLRVIESRTDRTIVMYAGQIVEQGPTSAVFSSPRSPYTQMLLNSLPEHRSAESRRFHSIPGHPPSLSPPPGGCSFSTRCPSVASECRDITPELEIAADDQSRSVRCLLAETAASKVTVR